MFETADVDAGIAQEAAGFDFFVVGKVGGTIEIFKGP